MSAFITKNVLSWNGFLFKYQVDQIMEMEANGRKPTPEMIKEMSYLQDWLQKKSGKDVRVFIPDEIYIRHTLNVRDVVDPLTGKEIIKGEQQRPSRSAVFPTISTCGAESSIYRREFRRCQCIISG